MVVSCQRTETTKQNKTKNTHTNQKVGHKGAAIDERVTAIRRMKVHVVDDDLLGRVKRDRVLGAELARQFRRLAAAGEHDVATAVNELQNCRQVNQSTELCAAHARPDASRAETQTVGNAHNTNTQNTLPRRKRKIAFVAQQLQQRRTTTPHLWPTAQTTASGRTSTRRTASASSTCRQPPQTSS